MSQVAAASGYQAGSATAALTNPEVDELREYQKIIQFRDTVVSGKHPRIKVPASSVVKNATQPPSNAAERVAPRVAPPSTQPSTQLPTSTAANSHLVDNMLSFKANSQQPAVNTPPGGSTPATFIPGVSKSFGSGSGSGKPEINPVLLQKSDDLVKAEIQIQRQRIEKALKDQVEQRKAAMRTNLQPSEQLPDLDLSDILAKALTVVQATAPPPSTSLPIPNANASEASDSFDENTFYSSQHDTPESRPSVPARDAVEDVQMRDVPTNATSAVNYVPSSQPTAAQSFSASISGPPQTNVARNISRPQDVGVKSQSGHPLASTAAPSQGHSVDNTSRMEPRTLLNQVQRHREQLETQVISSDSRGASRSDNSGNTDSEQSADHRRLQNPQHLPNPHFRHVDEPLIRAHNLSPLAPQPSHVSPLAVARQPPTVESDSGNLHRAPAQVNVLRQEHTVVISPESSPQGEMGSKKNKKKKNKRKADERAQDAPGSPNIKSEPRSPSPLAAPPYIRRQKRQRRSGRHENEFIRDEVVLDRPISQLHPERYQPVSAHVERIPQGYEVVDYPYPRQVRPSVAPVTYRPESPLYEERRADGSIIRYVRRVPSPLGYPDPYGVVEPRSQRAASYTVANPDVREIPTYEREGRMSVRPYTDRARSRSPVLIDGRSTVMPPPSAPPRRIIVDEYGREYLEPVRATTVSRQSVMPSIRPGDHEVAYERGPIQVTSRLPAQEIVGEDGVVYRRASPGYAPRRVVTQPDHGTNFRSYRERDYSAQAVGPLSHEFVQIRGATEHRGPELMPRDYVTRATSVRPAIETMPYDRLSSSRPDVVPRQYTASVHPEARREVAPHVVREYSVRPNELDVPQRAYSVRPVERYYEQPPREGDITYIERPRPVHQEIIYPGNGTSSQVYQ